MDIIAVIPARYGSTRFPAKVLARDTGKYLIQHTYERAAEAKKIDRVLVATDDQRVFDAVSSFSGECVMTSAEHQSGTDRIAEAVKDLDADIVINVQGDEPEIDPDNIDFLARMLEENPDAPMATLGAGFQKTEQVQDPNAVKVIRDSNGRAIYFSRSVIPYARDEQGVGGLDLYMRHLGIYAYRKEFLLKITSLPRTKLEKCEKLEQLRALENGYSILLGEVEHRSEGIDTPEQYAEFVTRYQQHKKD